MAGNELRTAELRRLCEVRMIIQMPDREARTRYFALCEEHRPREAVDALREAVKQWWRQREALDARIAALRGTDS